MNLDLEGNEQQVSPVDIRPFSKGGVCKQTRKRKSRVSAILTDTPVKAAFESEVKAHRKPAKRNRLLRAATKRSHGNVSNSERSSQR